MRAFNLVGDADSNKHIEDIKITNPSPVNTLVTFKFDKWRLGILYDETADDDTDYMLEQVRNIAGEGEFLLNPNLDTKTYALLHRGKTVYLFSSHASKKRLDALLAELHPDTSRSAWQKHIRAGRVEVNDKIITTPREEVSMNDHIRVDLPETPDFNERTLPIIYLDDAVIVIDKPVGILAHAKGVESEEFTVADFFRRYTSAGLDTNRPGIVHRLDRDTSGIMIGARTPEANTLLARQFAERKAKKVYIAVLSGHLKQKEAVVELPIGRNPAMPSTFRVDANGRHATTHYRVIAENERESLVELRPVTGRTHQLRVHMTYLGAPIKGDRVYGKISNRLYLHARSLEITIPTSDRRVFESPVPIEFSSLFSDMPL